MSEVRTVLFILLQVPLGRPQDLLNREYLHSTLRLWVLWFGVAFTYYGMVLASSEVLRIRNQESRFFPPSLLTSLFIKKKKKPSKLGRQILIHNSQLRSKITSLLCTVVAGHITTACWTLTYPAMVPYAEESGISTHWSGRVSSCMCSCDKKEAMTANHLVEVSSSVSITSTSFEVSRNMHPLVKL